VRIGSGARSRLARDGQERPFVRSAGHSPYGSLASGNEVSVIAKPLAMSHTAVEQRRLQDEVHHHRSRSNCDRREEDFRGRSLLTTLPPAQHRSL